MMISYLKITEKVCLFFAEAETFFFVNFLGKDRFKNIDEYRGRFLYCFPTSFLEEKILGGDL